MVLQIKLVEVGMFRLPGIVFDRAQLTDEINKEMDEWVASPAGTGTRMTDVLWSFKTESQRDWFILRWGDADADR